MSLIAKDKGGADDWEPISAGIHQGICIALWDLGHQTSQRFGNEYPKIALLFETPDEMIEFQDQSTGQMVTMPKVASMLLTRSLHKKANMRSLLEGWRGRPFTPAELSGFDLRNIVGKCCTLQIFHEQRDDGTVNHRIKSIFPWPKGQPPIKPAHELIIYDIDDPVIPEKTPDWVKTFIANSREHRQRYRPDPSNPYDSPPQDGTTGKDDFDDDIPF